MPSHPRICLRASQFRRRPASRPHPDPAADLEGFYAKGRVATYLLWRYENYLRTQTGRQWPRLDWHTVVSPAGAGVRYAKDHIQPRNEDNPVLRSLVTWDPTNQDESPRPFRDVYLHRLGNLVLDTVAAGASRGCRPFAERVDYYRNSTLLSQAEIVSRFAGTGPGGNPVWDGAAIRKRHDALVSYALGLLLARLQEEEHSKRGAGQARHRFTDAFRSRQVWLLCLARSIVADPP